MATTLTASEKDGPGRGCVSTGALLVFALVLGSAIASGFERGPIHAASCVWNARSGWVVEVPEAPVTLSEFREAVDEQTGRCVRFVVEGPSSDSATVLEPSCCRVAVEGSRVLQVTTR